jgi:hypothetical protein
MEAADGVWIGNQIYWTLLYTELIDYISQIIVSN